MIGRSTDIYIYIYIYIYILEAISISNVFIGRISSNGMKVTVKNFFFFWQLANGSTKHNEFVMVGLCFKYTGDKRLNSFKIIAKYE